MHIAAFVRRPIFQQSLDEIIETLQKASVLRGVVCIDNMLPFNYFSQSFARYKPF